MNDYVRMYGNAYVRKLLMFEAQVRTGRQIGPVVLSTQILSDDLVPFFVSTIRTGKKVLINPPQLDWISITYI